MGPNIGFAQEDDLTFGQTPEGNIQFGRVLINPGFTVKGEYNDNVFKEADHTFKKGTVDEFTEGKSEDFIFTLSPFIKASLERNAGDPFGFEFGYKGEKEIFVDLENEDTFNHYIDGVVELGGAGGRTDMELGGYYHQTTQSSSSEFDSNLNPRSERFDKAVFADANWQLTQLFRLNLNTKFADVTYDEPSLDVEEASTWDLGGTVFWQYSIPLEFGLKYNFRSIDYEINLPNSDSTTNSVSGVVIWEPTSTLTAELELGVESRDYEEDEDNIPDQDRTDARVKLVVAYHPTDRSRFSLTGTREIADSTFDSGLPLGRIQSVEVTSALARWQQKLGLKMESDISLGWDNLNYSELALDSASSSGQIQAREDNIFLAGAALNYDIQKWLRTRAEYRFRTNQSNFGDKDYEQSIISLSMTAVF
jgi:hypothetical protein